MKARVKKWGNSLALRIPKSFATEAGLTDESSVEVSLSEGNLVITPISRPKVTLKELISQITPENQHGEIHTGAAVGREVW